MLDPALIRPGRLDRMLVVHAPDADGRRDIIQHYLSTRSRTTPTSPIELMVNDSMGWTPIMIKTIINEALIQAHHDGREFLTYKDWLDAADERALGPQAADPVVEPRPTAARLAYHEAGHAVAAHYLQPEHRISKATIIRRGHALGYVQQRPREERTSLYARSIETQIMVSLAGHVVEDRFLDKLIDRAVERPPVRDAGGRGLRRIARDGPDEDHHPDASRTSRRSDRCSSAPTSCSTAYEETERLLREKEPAVHHLAKALIERDELIGEELEEVFAEVEAAHPQLRAHVRAQDHPVPLLRPAP